jgi:maltose alpha-D-glucosyltransferase/alpha-amylase
MSAAFVAAYRAATRPASVFPTGDAADRLLRVLTLTRVFYEIGYELANRPSWTIIPLAGAVDLLFPELHVPTDEE